MKEFILQESITFAEGKATTLIFMPTPGVAYWRAESEIGAQPVQFDATIFSDASSVFTTMDVSRPVGATSEASSKLVDRFRYTSLAAELECTMNEFKWAGTIQVSKAQIRQSVTHTGDTITDVGLTLEGLQSVANMMFPNGQVYTAPLKDGFYTPSMNQASTFNWVDVAAGAYNDSITAGHYRTGPFTSYVSDCVEHKSDPNAAEEMILKGPFVGVDEHDCIIVRVVVPAGAGAQSCLLKAWHTIEFVPMAGSLFAEMALPSPDYDLPALKVYEEIARNLPVAVKQADNPNFWQRVKKGVLSGSSLLSKLPGPFGVVAKGVHALFNLF
jgi:hypothetical protein